MYNIRPNNSHNPEYYIISKNGKDIVHSYSIKTAIQVVKRLNERGK